MWEWVRIFAEFPAARRTYEDADALLGWPVTSTSFAGPAETLNDTRYTQPAKLVDVTGHPRRASASSYVRRAAGNSA
ncbi:MAG TPA: hypothetical protein PK384_03335, partial [Candidatus Latescibacteria bacterium]|nr:hypothetical protein [Candidatus Latescibacterota bacterium]